MPTVTLCGSTIRIGRTALRRIDRRLHHAPIITDRHVARTPFVRRLRRTLKGPVFLLEPGERTKTLRTAETLYRWLSRRGVQRDDCLVAVGGGVVIDLAGFVAATYLRGISAALIPTTLLAQVDAAIGGKNAVNLPEGKNLVGTIAPPRWVLVDPAALASLPERTYRSGLAEVVKTAVIADGGLFDLLARRTQPLMARDGRTLEQVITRTIRIKADVVSRDERDRGLRAVLNYGHTIGHALEAAGGYRRYLHGEAVAVGMEAEGYLAVILGMLSEEALQAQSALLDILALPRRARGVTRRSIMKHLSVDKKIRGGRLRFALPDRIGRVRFPVEPPAAAVRDAVEHVLAA